MRAAGMSGSVPPHLVPGWIIDAVLEDRTHTVVVAARGTETVTAPAQARYATIAVARPGHQDAARRAHDELLARGTVRPEDVIESVVVMWDGSGVLARVLRPNAPCGTAPRAVVQEPAAGLEPLGVAEGLPQREELAAPEVPPVSQRRRVVVRSFSSKLLPRPSAKVALVAVVLASALAASAMVVRRSGDDAVAHALGRAQVITWDPATATASVARDGDVLTYQLGEPGDELLLGDWEGTGQRTPALYRPSTGDLWFFTGWATAQSPVSPTLTVQAGAHGRPRVVSDDGRDLVTVSPLTPRTG